MQGVNKAPIILDNGLPESMPQKQQLNILKTRTGGWVHRAIQMGVESISDYKDLPENYVFDDSTKKLLLEKAGINVLRIGENGDIEGIIPAETAQGIGLSEENFYVSIGSKETIRIPMSAMNSYSPTTIKSEYPILPQMYRSAKRVASFTKDKGKPIEDIYRKLYDIWTKTTENGDEAQNKIQAMITELKAALEELTCQFQGNQYQVSKELTDKLVRLIPLYDSKTHTLEFEKENINFRDIAGSVILVLSLDDFYNAFTIQED